MLSVVRASLLIVIGLSLVAAVPARRALSALADDGAKLSDEQAGRLAVELRRSPDDADLRSQLAGYYQFRKAANREQRTKNILWLIEHRPGDAITTTAYCMIDAVDESDAYAKGKAVWDHQLGANSTNAIILANGSAFRAAADFGDAEGLLEQAAVLEPKNSTWPEKIAILQEQRLVGRPEEAVKLAAKALEQRQLAYNLTADPQHRFHVLIRMPDDALLSQDLIQAKRLGKQLVGAAAKFRDDLSYGDAIHRGNIVLGEAALQAGIVDRAEEYLKAASHTPGSVALEKTGPDLHLAKQLLARGERTAVREYLANCMTFWKSGSQRLKVWTATLDAGGLPDF